MRQLILLMLLLTAFGCKSNDPDHLIVGDWLWTGSGGGIGGVTIKPRPNERVTVQFKRKGDFSVFRNDTLQISGTYSLIKFNGTSRGKDESAIEIGATTNHKAGKFLPIPVRSFIGSDLMNRLIIIELDRKNLFVGESMSDGFNSRFTRLK